nr:MAG TPA: hypothetical protein [Caudoviricetes sp.]
MTTVFNKILIEGEENEKNECFKQYELHGHIQCDYWSGSRFFKLYFWRTLDPICIILVI